MALNEQKEEIHVLMVAFDTQGHINPLLRLGKRLVSKRGGVQAGGMCGCSRWWVLKPEYPRFCG